MRKKQGQKKGLHQGLTERECGQRAGAVLHTVGQPGPSYLLPLAVSPLLKVAGSFPRRLEIVTPMGHPDNSFLGLYSIHSGIVNTCVPFQL